jgi:hypothetical protein
MQEINYQIVLCSDAEPGSGFGTKLTDSLVPTNASGKVVVPATHIKGVIRENLERSAGRFLGEQVIAQLFGAEGSLDGSLAHFEAAVSRQDKKLSVSRTSLNQHGVALGGSLRTSEAIAKGSVFEGRVMLKNSAHQNHVALLKLGLLSMTAVGGNRNRGAGACYVKIDGESRTPGEILRFLATQRDWRSVSHDAGPAPVIVEGEKLVVLKLVFDAKNPVCVPETPVTANNMINSGFSIPASAVQGTILHRINETAPELATACFENDSFRVWPLNPSNEHDDMSIRVSMTHKVSKLPDESGSFLFMDDSWEPYEVAKIPAHAPLRSADGVLLVTDDGVKLWKSSMMAREITAHGVINGDRGNGQKRNLYVVESLAPARFCGLAVLPENAASVLIQSLQQDPHVQIGKARSVRGGGLLYAEIVEFESLPFLHDQSRTFIVQSPILVEREDVGKPLSDIVAGLVKAAGWGDVELSSGTITTQFGWNRTRNRGFIGAEPVIAPGAVFKLKNPPVDLKECLVKGLGKGKQRGFGAILPHPGIARDLYTVHAQIKSIAAQPNYGLEGYELSAKAQDNQLSVSQIARVRELLEHDPAAAIDYLRRQQEDRPAAIWDRWKLVMQDIEQGINNDAAHFARVMKVCQDLMS